MFTTYYLLLVFIPVVLSEKPEGRSVSDHFHQYEYKMIFERAELYRYTKSLYNRLSIVTYKYNRTSPVVNLTFSCKLELGNKLEVIVQAYRFASNEYRLFPIRFEVNYCTAVKADMVGIGTTHCGNFTNCYIRKNTVYHACNWAPNQYRFPPGVPTGKYMVELQLLYFSQELFVVRGYGEIARPPPIPQ